MAAREQMGTDIEPTFVQRVAAGVKYVVTGVSPENWFGPWNPLAPIAQDKTEGRQFDYPVGFNLRILPRSDEAVSFGQLRGLADGYDLLRLVIETRKDQIEAFEWEIVPKDPTIDASTRKDAIKKVTDFMQSPDKERDWPQWLRMQAEDAMVIDAIAVYPRVARGGQLYGFELIDGATLKRVIDVTGRTPLPPSPAYQQVLKGVPTADYTREDIIYNMRNPRTNKVYGYSPVEQTIMTVSIALRRQLSQLDYYTSGNIPEAIAQVPETWTAKQIADFQTWWDSVLEGNTAAKRKMRFIPLLKDIVFPKEQLLKDEFDEWLARIICFAFSISPSALIKQVNRASGEQMADTAKEEGLIPFLRFFANHFTRLVSLIDPELKFQWKMQNKLDPKAQADVHAVYLTNKVMTPDEVREEIGKDPLTPEQREEAWPTPPAPLAVEFDEEGNPLPPAPVPPGLQGGALKPTGAAPAGGKLPPFAKKPTGEGAEAEAAPTAAEKMLGDVIAMLDPLRVADLAAKLIKAQPPTVVEFRPEINVEVGDTEVHVPVQRAEV